MNCFSNKIFKSNKNTLLEKREIPEILLFLSHFNNVMLTSEHMTCRILNTYGDMDSVKAILSMI